MLLAGDSRPLFLFPAPPPGRGNTKDTYADTLRLHIIPFPGKARLAEMNRTAARNHFTALEEAGRSPDTIRQAKVTLAAMFTMAVPDGYLNLNPFHDVKTPKVPGPRPIKIATTEDYLTVRDCLPTRATRVFSILLVSSGLRFCEATGLRPLDFDFPLSHQSADKRAGRLKVALIRRRHASCTRPTSPYRQPIPASGSTTPAVGPWQTLRTPSIPADQSRQRL